MEIGMLLNVSISKNGVRLRYPNTFSHVQPTTAERWLQAFAIWWNHA
jgi:hypothetical protein